MKKLTFALFLILFNSQFLFAQTTCSTFTGTVNQIRALSSSGYCYAVSTDYGTGNWYLDASDHSSHQDVGTVLVDTIGRVWKRIYSGPVFVDWYCITKPDSTSDYTTQIQSCFTHAKPHQTISFGNGTYKFTSVSITDTDFTITGTKSRLIGTIVVGNADTPKTYNSTITGLTFLTRDTGMNAINLINCQKLVISDNVFNNYDKAIYVEPVSNSTAHTTGKIEISNGNLFNNVKYCFYVAGSTVAGAWNTTNDCTFSGNVANTCLVTAVYCKGIDGLKYLNNTIFTPSGTTGPEIGNKLNHLRIDNSSDRVIVNNNNFFESGHESILLQNCNDLNVNGNNFVWSGQSNIYSVIRDYGTTTGIIVNVTGNIINGFSGNAVQIDAPGYGNINVSSNNIYYSDTLPDYFGPVTDSLKYFQHYILYAPVGLNSVCEKNFFIETTNFHSTFKNSLISKSETLAPYAATSYLTDTSTFDTLRTAVKIAGVYDAGLSPSPFGGLVNITARGGNSSTSNTANYVLLIDPIASPDSARVICKAGLTGGASASQPSFTFSTNGNILYATPVGATNGTFYFYISSEGDLITPYHGP